MNKPLSILFIATSSNANSGGGRTRLVDMTRETQRHGFAPYILCFVYASQFFGGIRHLLEGRVRLAADSGCAVYYIPLLPFGRLAAVEWLNRWLGGLFIAFLARFRGISILFGHGTLAGHICLSARTVNPRLRVVSDMQGAIVDEYLYERGASVPDATARRMARYEEETLIQSDRLVFVSQAMKLLYEARFARPFGNAFILPSAVRADRLPDPARRSALRREQGLEDKFVLCYAGSAETYQLPDVMCRLFKNLLPHIPNAFFLILSHQANIFENHLRAEGIEASRYKILSVPHAQIFDWLQAGDVGLLLRTDSVVNRVASPTKFAEYCLCGLPVLTTPYVGDFSREVKERSLGHWVDIANPQADASMLAFLHDVSLRRSDHASRCAAFARRHLTWEEYGQTLKELLLSLTA